MSALQLEIQRVADEADAQPDDDAFRRWVETALSQQPKPVELVIRLVDEEESGLVVELDGSDAARVLRPGRSA